MECRIDIVFVDFQARCISRRINKFIYFEISSLKSVCVCVYERENSGTRVILLGNEKLIRDDK